MALAFFHPSAAFLMRSNGKSPFQFHLLLCCKHGAQILHRVISSLKTSKILWKLSFSVILKRKRASMGMCIHIQTV